jgi:endonuclease/exonuclease/phosphatase family metal-dependent hydrolase
MQTKLNVFDKTILLSNLFFSFLLMASYLSPVINPLKCSLFAYLGLAYPGLVAINLVYCFYWLFRFKIYVVVPLVSILAGFNILCGYWGFYKNNADSTVTGGTLPIRMMTYNVHNFNGLNQPINLPAYTSILNLIKQQNPDIITFQEFHQQNAQYHICDSLKKVMHNADYYFEPFEKTGHDSTGLAIFSRLPILNKGVVRLSAEECDNQAIYVDLKTAGSIVRVYCVHLQSVKFDTSDEGFVQKFNLTDFRAMSKIYDKLGIAFKTRSSQTTVITQHAKMCKYPYVFAGDFNDSPISYSVGQMSANLKNAFREKGSGIGVTYNQNIPALQIDYIMVSNTLKVINYHIIKQKISDHYPVLSELILK